jgi:hypothetical protein
MVFFSILFVNNLDKAVEVQHYKILVIEVATQTIKFVKYKHDFINNVRSVLENKNVLN